MENPSRELRLISTTRTQKVIPYPSHIYLKGKGVGGPQIDVSSLLYQRKMEPRWRWPQFPLTVGSVGSYPSQHPTKKPKRSAQRTRQQKEFEVTRNGPKVAKGFIPPVAPKAWLFKMGPIRIHNPYREDPTKKTPCLTSGMD